MTIEIPTIPAFLLAVTTCVMFVSWTWAQHKVDARVKKMWERTEEMKAREERVLDRVESLVRKLEEDRTREHNPKRD